MKIYYEVDCITDNCLNKCPFVDINCQVGSVNCHYLNGEYNDNRH